MLNNFESKFSKEVEVLLNKPNQKKSLLDFNKDSKNFGALD